MTTATPNTVGGKLEWSLVYSIVVAGKSAHFADRAMARIDNEREGSESLFDCFHRIAAHGGLDALFRRARTGNYGKMCRAIGHLLSLRLDLATCSVEDLEAAPGIGPKTSRFFLLWTRPGVEYAALDVHVLRWLRAEGYDAPKSTPTGKRYATLERAFLREARQRGMTARELDSQIWSAARVRASPTGENTDAAPLFTQGARDAEKPRDGTLPLFAAAAGAETGEETP